jgi:hypothetical protein
VSVSCFSTVLLLLLKSALIPRHPVVSLLCI